MRSSGVQLRALVTVGWLNVDVGCTRRRQYGMGLAMGIYVLGAVGLFAALLSPTYDRYDLRPIRPLRSMRSMRPSGVQLRRLAVGWSEKP